MGRDLQNQIYAQPHPAMDRREQVTGGNTYAPVWRGKEIWYAARVAR